MAEGKMNPLEEFAINNPEFEKTLEKLGYGKDTMNRFQKFITHENKEQFPETHKDCFEIIETIIEAHKMLIYAIDLSKPTSNKAQSFVDAANILLNNVLTKLKEIKD